MEPIFIKLTQGPSLPALLRSLDNHRRLTAPVELPEHTRGYVFLIIDKVIPQGDEVNFSGEVTLFDQQHNRIAVDSPISGSLSLHKNTGTAVITPSP